MLVAGYYVFPVAVHASVSLSYIHSSRSTPLPFSNLCVFFDRFASKLACALVLRIVNGQSLKSSDSYCPCHCLKNAVGTVCILVKFHKSDWKKYKLSVTSRILSVRVICPCSEAIFMYKIIKNLFKIRLKSNYPETCNKLPKHTSFLQYTLPLLIKILSPGANCPLHRALYMRKTIKT